MAEELQQEAVAPKRKAAPKRKTTARRKATAAPRKTTARRKAATAQRKTTTRGRRAAAKAPVTLQSRVSEASRKAFLASLGFYGMAYDQFQDQLKTVESELSARRKKADKLYSSMVKRGEKVEKQARAALDDIELPKFELEQITDRQRIEARIEQARERFNELKGNFGLRSAA